MTVISQVEQNRNAPRFPVNYNGKRGTILELNSTFRSWISGNPRLEVSTRPLTWEGEADGDRLGVVPFADELRVVTPSER